MGERRDEPKPLTGLANTDVARRSAGLIVGIFQGPTLLQVRANQGERQVTVRPVLVDLAHGHGLDQREIETFVAAPADEVVEFAIVDAAQGYRIDLDLVPCVPCRTDTVQNLGEVAAPRDRAEFLRIERIKGNIYTAHTRRKEIASVFSQLATVGRQRELIQAPGLQVTAEAVEQLHDVATDQRFTTRDPQLADTPIDECTADAIELFQAENI